MTVTVQNLITKDEMLRQVEKMNSFGPRLTGNAAHKGFIEYLKNEIHSLGIETYSEPYFFNRWEEKRSSLVIHDETGDKDVHISSVFPYSGETDENGITAELSLITDQRLGFLGLAGKIAVVKIDEMNFLPSTIAFHIRNRLPESASIPEKYNGPVATSFVNFPFLQNAKAAGCKAVVCVWDGMSDDMIEGQYLPFILDYQGLPCVWVNATDGQTVISAAKRHIQSTLTVEAEKEYNCSTETFYCILPGENKSEAILINTHTDGTNCIEENGPLAMLTMLKYFKEKKLDRTLIFVFATGHFRLPNFKTVAGGGVQATSKWLASHTDLWDGKDGHIKAVACVSIEHLGSVMWKDRFGVYQKVGDVETELVYTGNDTLDRIYFECLEGREKVNTVTLRGHNFLHFGEGQPPFNCGIPEISLVTAPDCLTVISENDEMDKFDIDLMYEQTDTFLRITDTLLPLSASEIGKCDGYSWVFPNGEPLVYRTIKKVFKKSK